MDASLLSPESVAELKENLRKERFMSEIDEYRLELEENWSPPNSIYPKRRMLELDSIPSPQNLGERLPHIKK